MENTVTQVKRLLGRKFSEPGVQAEMQSHLNFKLTQLKDDDIGIEVGAIAEVARTRQFLRAVHPAPPLPPATIHTR